MKKNEKSRGKLKRVEKNSDARIFTTRRRCHPPCPDPRALHLFPEPWTKVQGYTQDLETRLSPEQLEFIFEYILNGCGKGIESLPLQRWNEYFQIKSMKTALSTNRGIELWKKFCENQSKTFKLRCVIFLLGYTSRVIHNTVVIQTVGIHF